MQSEFESFFVRDPCNCGYLKFSICSIMFMASALCVVVVVVCACVCMRVCVPESSFTSGGVANSYLFGIFISSLSL